MFDCADVQQRPPLAKGLVDPAYNQIAAECPECRPIIDRLRERMDGATSLELELAHLVEVSNESPERRRQLTAFRFYLRRVIEDATIEVLRATSGYTRYLRLMNSLYDWHRRSEQPIRIVTFNYDVILEDTLQSVFGGWDLRRELARFIERDDCRLQTPRVGRLVAGRQGPGSEQRDDARRGDDACRARRSIRRGDRTADPSQSGTSATRSSWCPP
ncbi:MAG: hypothetical protein ACLP8S_06420 [Solirubrobacteraceae bacterium]